MNIIVEDANNTRLDKFLTEKLLDYTRNQIKNLIKNNSVFVNNKLVNSSYIVKQYDEIFVKLTDNNTSLKAEKKFLDIVYEDEYFIIINKERDMQVYPSKNTTTGTLANFLIYYTNELSNIHGELRPGIVNRLDKDTTGLIIIAKNNDIHNIFNSMMLNHEIEKYYLAIVQGEFDNEEGSIDIPIGRDINNRTIISSKTNKARNALTKYKVISSNYNFALVECKIITGRMHQIRVHMKEINHPLVGDLKYSIKNNKKNNIADSIQYPMLHSYKLEFIHPINKTKLVITKKPDDLFIETLKLLNIENKINLE